MHSCHLIYFGRAIDEAELGCELGLSCGWFGCSLAEPHAGVPPADSTTAAAARSSRSPARAGGSHPVLPADARAGHNVAFDWRLGEPGGGLLIPGSFFFFFFHFAN